MSSTFAVFFVVLLGVLAAGNHSVLRWANRAFSLPARGRRILALILWISLGTMTLGRVLDRVASSAPVCALLLVAYVIQLAVLISAVLLLFVDLGVLVGRLARRLRTSRSGTSERRDAVAPEMSGAVE